MTLSTYDRSSLLGGRLPAPTLVHPIKNKDSLTSGGGRDSVDSLSTGNSETHLVTNERDAPVDAIAGGGSPLPPARNSRRFGRHWTQKSPQCSPGALGQPPAAVTHIMSSPGNVVRACSTTPAPVVNLAFEGGFRVHLAVGTRDVSAPPDQPVLCAGGGEGMGNSEIGVDTPPAAKDRGERSKPRRGGGEVALAAKLGAGVRGAGGRTARSEEASAAARREERVHQLLRARTEPDMELDDVGRSEERGQQRHPRPTNERDTPTNPSALSMRERHLAPTNEARLLFRSRAGLSAAASDWPVGASDDNMTGSRASFGSGTDTGQWSAGALPKPGFQGYNGYQGHNLYGKDTLREPARDLPGGRVAAASTHRSRPLSASVGRLHGRAGPQRGAF